jgi:hypothetical protein
MTQADYIATSVWLIATVAALLMIYFWGFLPQFRAAFRHEIFALRRELLLLAAEKKISVNDPAYLSTRKMLNGLLQIVDYLTGFEVLIFGLLYRGRRSKEPDVTCNNLEVEAIRKRTLGVTVGYILRLVPFSPALWFAFLLRGLLRGGPLPEDRRTAKQLAWSVDRHAQDVWPRLSRNISRAA